MRVLFTLALIFVTLTPSFADTDERPRFRLPDYDQDSKASPHSYVADTMMVRRPMPINKDWKPMNFYFRHCTEIGEKYYYSKTAYECADDLY